MIKKSFKSALLFLPWLYLICLGLNFTWNSNYYTAINLAFTKLPEPEKNIPYAKSQLQDLALFQQAQQELLSNKNLAIENKINSGNLTATWEGSTLKLIFKHQDPIISQKFIEMYATLFSENFRNRLKVNQAQQEQLQFAKLSKFAEEINHHQTSIIAINKKINLAPKEELILQYQESAKSLRPKHPQMIRLLADINYISKSRKKLSSEDVLNYTPGTPAELSKLQQELDTHNFSISDLQDRTTKIKASLEKVSVPLLPTILSYPIATPLLEQSWVTASYQALVLALIFQIFILITTWLTPTFINSKSFVQQTNTDAEHVIPFPKLKPQTTSMQFLPSFITGQNQQPVSTGHQMITVSSQVLDLKQHRGRQADDQRILENLAAELIVKSKSKQHKFFLFTAGSAGAGCTTVVANLAVAFSNLSEKVLVIDANFNNSGVSDYFGVDTTTTGLTELMTSGQSAEHFIQKSDFAGLDILPLGLNKEAASKLISSTIFADIVYALEGIYNFILIDGGSILDSAQATLLSTELGAAYVVINANQTTKDVAKKALARLEKVKVQIDGVILNQAKS